MEPLDGVVFDIDDTLYLERDFVASGFRAVAASVEMKLDPNWVFDFLWERFLSGTRGNSFDLLKSAAGLEGESLSVSNLVNVYRNHFPDIALMPGYDALFTKLREARVRIGLISDGPYATQFAKAKALGVIDRVDHVALTGEWGSEFSKPHPRAFESFAAHWQGSHTSLLYVADNCVKDFVAPNRLGWNSIRLRLPGQIYGHLEPQDPEFAPKIEVRSVEELADFLMKR